MVALAPRSRRQASAIPRQVAETSGRNMIPKGPKIEQKSISLEKRSSGIKRDKLNGTNGAEFAVFRRFLPIFTDFRFSWKLQHFGGADFRRKLQETADFRRKPQKPADFCRNPFVPFSLSLLIPP